MPKKFEAQLKRQYAHKKGWSQAHKDRAIYGTLTNYIKRKQGKRVPKRKRRR